MKILNVSILLFLVVFTLGFLSSCQTSSIADLIHKDTNQIDEKTKFNFSDPKLEKYHIDGVFFIPYIPHRSHFTYDLRLAAYKTNGNNSKVTINSATIEGLEEINLRKVTSDKSTVLEFIEHKDNIQASQIPLIEQINDYDMGLTKKSKLKVVLNITVEENDTTITRDLEYTFETKIRTYLNNPVSRR
jgi:uncharacterized protein YlaN (UPF0358 family)